MKIIIINGSPRTNGATGQVLSEIENILLKTNESIELERFNLGSMDLQFCVGCFSCYKTGHCYIKTDGLEEVAKKIEQADGVIFASPTYASNVSGHFKVFIDRIQFVFEQLLHNKACFSVVTFENAEGSKAKKIINSLIRLSGGAVSCEYLLKLNHGEQAVSEQTETKLLRLCQRFVEKTKKKNPLTIFESVFRYIVFNVGLKPHAFKYRNRYKAIIDRWINNGFVREQ